MRHKGAKQLVWSCDDEVGIWVLFHPHSTVSSARIVCYAELSRDLSSSFEVIPLVLSVSPRSNLLIWNPQWKAGKQSLLLLLLRRQTIHQGNHWRHSKDSQDLSAWVATVCIYFCRNTSLSTPRRRWQSQAHPSWELSVCSLPNSQAHTVPHSKKAAKIKAYLKRDLTFSGVSKKLTDSFKVKATLTQRRNGVWGIVLLNHSVCLWYD